MHFAFSVDCICLFVYLCICLCMCTLCVKVDYWPSGRTLWCELLTLMDHCASSCLDSYQISWNVIITIKLSFGKGCFVKFVTRDLPKSIRQGMCTNLTKSLSFGHQWYFMGRAGCVDSDMTIISQSLILSDHSQSLFYFGFNKIMGGKSNGQVEEELNFQWYFTSNVTIFHITWDRWSQKIAN